jgi:hypothetical protein
VRFKLFEKERSGEVRDARAKSIRRRSGVMSGMTWVKWKIVPQKTGAK